MRDLRPPRLPWIMIDFSTVVNALIKQRGCPAENCVTAKENQRNPKVSL
jgi:hypothetical protein